MDSQINNMLPSPFKSDANLIDALTRKTAREFSGLPTSAQVRRDYEKYLKGKGTTTDLQDISWTFKSKVLTSDYCGDQSPNP